ncbi:hypothetical protein [Roseivirga pacifica]|uniref:hypothetical protein n=1 Tax=Roseivirga pacifica TaxID=1267423 RepID=UPI0020943E58|nr:hypothetical protein [Roseivirga pacifica]
MDPALQKTLTFILFILVGFLIRKKFANKDQVNGIKNMILTIALPSTIFVALMGVQIEVSMLIYPAMALVFNFALFAITPLLLKLFGIAAESAQGRTLALLLPSLAPGLSCFPFILEYLGEDALANAALADVGNKFFVLIFLYVVAMNLFLRRNKGEANGSKGKIKSLLLSLIQEPINMVIVLALVLLALGLNFESLPSFIGDTFSRFSLMMTPMVLLFIGLAVKIDREALGKVFCVLLSRAGISMLFSALIVTLFGLTNPAVILLAVVFPLSSCSFWPFAHMAAFDAKEVEQKNKQFTFDIEYGVLVLACSLPISTLLILGVLASGHTFANVSTIALSGVILIALGVLPTLLRRINWSTDALSLSSKDRKRMVEQTK